MPLTVPMTSFVCIESSVGPLTLLGDGTALTGVRFSTHQHKAWVPEADWAEDACCELLRDASRQLREYLAGTRQTFDVPLAPTGTDFQQRVWAELCRIPFGQTITYGELARRVGDPNASRAVGLANGRNPIAILIPCHRVIGANGSLTGFGGGVETKRWLLRHEGALLV